MVASRQARRKAKEKRKKEGGGGMEGKWERVKRTAGTWVNFSSRNGINSQVDKPRAGLVISILLRPCVIIWPGRRWKTIPFNLYRSRIISFFFLVPR